MQGKSLAHYQIVEKLGEGGMGVVWKAVDTKLDRNVAIKSLTEDFLNDSERVHRFEREAKVLASLNHRNIASIYGIEEADGQRFLVMELVEGEDLATKLLRGSLPVDESVDICHQLARGFEAAHEGGVLHRDLKPANIRVTHEGRVKILDFGLAKAFGAESTDSEPSFAPTRTSGKTAAGVILGTAAYMSPEQTRGKPVDKRTDIWAFGCVLYECLTGRSAFRGETMSDTLAAILKSAPDWSQLPPETPPRVRELLQRCLEKDARNRLRDIGDARLELQRSITGHESMVDSSGLTAGMAADLRIPRSFSTAAVAGTLVAGLVIGAGLWALLGGGTGASGSGRTGVTRLSVSYPKHHLIGGTQLTPDGKAIVFGATPERSSDPEGKFQQLYIQSFDRYGAEKIAGTDGVTGWCLSPDGDWVAMLTPVAPKSSKFRLAKVPIDGSAPPLVLLEWPENWVGNLQWLPDGDLLAMVQGEPPSFVRIPTDGSPVKEPVEIVNREFEGQFGYNIENEAVLPDGVHVLGGVTTYTERGFDFSVGVMNSETGDARLLIENGNFPRWSPTGHLLFSRGDTLLAVPFDPDELTPTGAQVAITDGLRANSIYADANFRLSRDGTLLHWPGGLVGGSRKLQFLSPEFEVEEAWSDDLRAYERSVTVSPDGRRLAVSIVNPEGLYDIWVSDMDRPRLTQIVHDPRRDCAPFLWSRDGEHLIYGCGDTTGGAFYRIAGDGSGEPEELLTQGRQEGFVPHDFLPDDSGIILSHFSEGNRELRLLRLDADPYETTVLLDDAQNARLSPDERWLAYQSDHSGRNEIYLRRFNTDTSLGPEIPVSTDGGGGPWWHRGKDAALLEIYYVSQFEIRSVTVTVGARVDTSEPKFVADVSELLRKFGGAFDALPDGRGIAIMRGDNEEPPTEANVVLNWFEELRERLGDDR